MKKLATTFGLLALMLIVTSFTTPNEIGGKGTPIVKDLGQYQIGGKGTPIVKDLGQFQIGGKGTPIVKDLGQ